MPFYDKFEPEDYYLTEEGFIVFTEKYHLKRGYCCHSNCRHCPYRNKNNKQPEKDNSSGPEDKPESI